jgi:hypothetical protein
MIRDPNLTCVGPNLFLFWWIQLIFRPNTFFEVKNQTGLHLAITILMENIICACVFEGPRLAYTATPVQYMCIYIA